MSVTRIDVLNKTFSRSMRGYSCPEVDQFLQDVADSLGRLAEENKAQAQRLGEMEKHLEEYRERDRTLRDTLVATQKMTEEMKANAQREAQLIIDAANAKGEALLNNAHAKLARVHEDIAELKKLRTQFEIRIQAVLDSHRKLLEMEREEDFILEGEAKNVSERAGE